MGSGCGDVGSLEHDILEEQICVTTSVVTTLMEANMVGGGGIITERIFLWIRVDHNRWSDTINQL